ncbi:vasoactive intestinal polypeptide receptor 2 [Dendroctonus ponderosae]|uniref:vasoactive intestinal polypeptide receptor 2 n=1 Tax=Dendroctonus ponderosae TaxID=77166 RepID=UPI0020354E22|nr:vasoactive intestinal polypeptide receptor 2 [Dendroctonus ponderosae]XP_019772886.2 vasoactive intestinal polypeptide receptor 2 [Dendroctonus ponderosae]XP_048524868.1 vasoactive intestinal polypeptide receptor 2 [Dendroctonus ponderosae]KAH1010629.1 hypothetical protein HUJ05_004895 [Dendroctonus ponderosae]
MKSNNQHIKTVQHRLEKAANETRIECISKYSHELRLDTQNNPYIEPLTKKIMCPPYFDTIICWPPQLPNTTASTSCPSYVFGFSKIQNATRFCLETGQWLVNAKGMPFTNFSTCGNKTATVFVKEDLVSQMPTYDISEETVDLIMGISETGYAISLITLLIAFTIMFKIKKLHCARNILHMNLFASFILRSFMHIMKNSLFMDGLGLSKDIVERNGSNVFHVQADGNNFECKLIVSLVQYFTTANYSWILMEGLYLNNLILRALFTDSNKNLIYYITFGWGLPLLVVVPWVIARILFDDTLCWTTNDNFEVFLIIIIPTFTSVLVNLVLFVIISVVLYNKLKSPINEDSRRYLKWAKSTLVLVPLFGVNYAIFLIFYFLNEQTIWMVGDALFGSFQGFFVAILYCFLNGEVKAEIKPYMSTVLVFLATNCVTKHCFPSREKYLSSAVGRQSVCTTMSCSSLYNNGVCHRNSKTKFDQLSKIKLSNLHEDNSKELFIPNGVRHSVPKTGSVGHYVPNLTFIHGRYPMNATTNFDTSANDTRPHHYSQNLPTCEEEVCMLEDSKKPQDMNTN